MTEIMLTIAQVRRRKMIIIVFLLLPLLPEAGTLPHTRY